MPKKETAKIEVQEITMEEIRFNVLGTSPLIMERYPAKAWHELLFPTGRASRATLEAKLKHDPIAEFRDGLYLNRDPKAPALVHMPNGAFHSALAQAGVDMPGAAKAKLERLTSVVNDNINLFGIPKLSLSMVRNSDMGRTPDVRSRPVFPEWACTVRVRFVKQLLAQRTIANLFGAAGVIVGVGGWRPQKGGSFGTFRLVSDSDADFKRIVAQQGRTAQQQAYDTPTCFDIDTEELLAWFEAELAFREKQAPSQADTIQPEKARKTRRRNGKDRMQMEGH